MQLTWATVTINKTNIASGVHNTVKIELERSPHVVRKGLTIRRKKLVKLGQSSPRGKWRVQCPSKKLGIACSCQ